MTSRILIAVAAVMDSIVAPAPAPAQPHISTLNATMLLATVLDAQGRLEEAEPLFLDAVRGRAKSLGPDNPLTAEAAVAYGTLLARLNRFADAEREPLQTPRIAHFPGAPGPGSRLRYRARRRSHGADLLASVLGIAVAAVAAVIVRPMCRSFGRSAQDSKEHEMKSSRFVRKAVLGLALVIVAAFGGGTAIGIAWATPPSEPGTIIPTVLAGPVVLDSLDLKIESDDYELELKTKGLSDARVIHFRVVPGAFFGWHTHPGPVFVMVTAGTLTYYDSHDPANGIDYPAGTGFVDQGGDHVHDARNHGDVDVEIVAFFLTPVGTPIRIDAPAPF